MPALQLAGIRQLAGGLLYLIFFMSKGRIWPRGKEWQTILILSFLNFMLSNALSTWGVKYISAGLASIIGATFPLWIVVIGLLNNKKSIHPKAIIGFVLGFAGICVIFYEHLQDFRNTHFLIGIFLSLAATWSWALGTIYTKQKAKAFNPYFSLGLQMIISGVIILVICEPTNISVPLKNIPWQSWASIIYLVIFSSVITFVAYLYALQHLSAEQTSVYAYINPIVAVTLGAILFHEKLTLFIAVGGAITLCGVYLINHSLRVIREKKPIVSA
jgi:drug/metabolite transporter (DMT)-like permease